jgi:hypothetical protein
MTAPRITAKKGAQTFFVSQAAARPVVACKARKPSEAFKSILCAKVQIKNETAKCF